ncbi:Extradiol ring-cleavage dioxygenase, class III enzyme, subunit B [Scheffersomyces amazonensis]|uniref:Extradiol ring-cleavage dioxygenase, class III enzyme, subunit B n=1 Tax=Scheffersomyces amazonensis TaxID=1078765 RepID=UPI00315CD6B9
MHFSYIIAIILSIATSYFYFIYSTNSATTNTPIVSQMTSTIAASSATATAIASKFIKNSNPFPTYFISHGGPTFMYENDDFGNKGAWNTVKKIGKTIKKNWKPDYIIVVSAHWQSSGNNLVEISVPKSSVDPSNELIYDFYGFPQHMYEEEFYSHSSPEIAKQIKEELTANGFQSQLTKRGIDHGVWVPFKVAFSDYNKLTRQPSQQEKQEGDLPDIPVIQVSLTSNDRDFQTHYKLGEVLGKFSSNKLWDEKQQKYLSGLIVCSGMSVHNLRDLGRSMGQIGQIMPYVKPFNKLLTETLTNSSDILKGLLELQQNKLLYAAHPTLEHFVPIVVASGINGNSQPVKEIYSDGMLSLGWNVYQFGNEYKL